MHVERLRIGAFGKLKGLDTGADPLPSLVAVHGPNEAGKTTFFHFLSTLLYGFHPASRDAHPYTPWEGGEVEGEALLRLADGEAWEVRRRLLSIPSGSLFRDGREEELRNRPLPCAEHVPRVVFRQVFALTLAELAGLEGESWAVVQDRLLGSMGSSDLRPSRAVAAELEKEAAELWRPNRRGRQRARELRERILELNRRRDAALETDRLLREKAAALEAARKELLALREERSACRSYLERFRTLLPLRAQLRRIDGLEIEAGDQRELERLPQDPRNTLDRIESRLAEVEELLARTIQEERDPRGRIEAYGRSEEQLVRRGEAVRALVARMLALDSEGVRRGHLEQEIRDLERRSETLISELFENGFGSAQRDAVGALRVSDLREAVKTHQAAADARRLDDENVRNLMAGMRNPPPAWLAWAVLLVSMVALGAGIESLSLLLSLFSVAPIMIGVVLLLMRGAAKQERQRLQAAQARAAQAASFQDESRAAAVEWLERLSLREALLGNPDLETVGALERLQEQLRDKGDRVRSLEALDTRARQVSASLGALAMELRLDLPSDPAAAAHLLSAKLREAESRRDLASTARRELERVMRARRRCEEEIERLRTERDLLQTQLLTLGEGDLVRGIETVRSRTEALGLARRLREELVKAHPDMREIRARIAEAETAGEEWTLDEDGLDRRKIREEELTDLIEFVTRRSEALSHEVERLRESETADAVEGELLLLEEELADLRRERDRCWLLARVVREADRRFREEHQPDIVKHAGVHLANITGGRYRRILVGDGVDGAFQVQGAGYANPIRVAQPISTGTREQIYLALRLAIVDHLDQGGERLPLFMDEAFVNWDPDRLGRGLDVLRGIAETRQVFVFSCHPDVVERLHGHGARVLRLDRAS